MQFFRDVLVILLCCVVPFLHTHTFLKSASVYEFWSYSFVVSVYTVYDHYAYKFIEAEIYHASNKTSCIDFSGHI